MEILKKNCAVRPRGWLKGLEPSRRREEQGRREELKRGRGCIIVLTKEPVVE